jgi:hypothetical protein
MEEQDQSQTTSSATEVASAIDDAQKAIKDEQYERAQAIAAVAIAEAMTRIVAKIDRATSPKMWRHHNAA